MESRLAKAFGRRAFLGAIPAVGAGGWATAFGFARSSTHAAKGIAVGPILSNATETSIDVMFEASGELAEVHWGPTAELGAVNRPRDTVSHSDQTIFHVTLADLTPATTYHYRVVTADAVSGIHQFTTPPARGARTPFRFAVYSDCQQRPDIHSRIVASEDAWDFVLVVGDIVHHGRTYDEYRERFYAPIAPVACRKPYYTVIGNHEADQDYYFDYQSLPRNGSPGFEEHWYSFDYGNAHFIGLDTNRGYRCAEQLAWLERDLELALADPRTEFLFAFFHHPWKSELWPDGEEAYAGEIIKRLEEALALTDKAGAFFHGHTHGYSRGQSKDAKLFWVNVGSAGGALDRWGGYPNQRPYPEIQRSYDDFGVTVFTVNAGERGTFAATRFGFGNEEALTDGVARDTFSGRSGGDVPQTPVIASARRGLVQASPFSDGGGQAHLETEWAFSRDEAGGDVVDAHWFRREKIYRDRDLMAGIRLTECSPDAAAAADANFVRVRYRNDQLAWSEWSAAAALA